MCETPESCLKTSGALCGREPGDPLMGKSRSSRVLVRGNRAARTRARPSSLSRQEEHTASRVHQLEKVELISLAAPEEGDVEHRRVLPAQLATLDGLELDARVVDIPVCDLCASATRKSDGERWIPSEHAFREVASCSKHDGLPGVECGSA